ncbi:MAG: DUF3298 domain-containing protein [Oscillospiraceae bacterium]|nr:DUF3298 domain-containing protein [Oscillospiraceae bacterium]
MKRFSFLLLAALMLLFAGCGTTDTPADTPIENDSQQQEITPVQDEEKDEPAPQEPEDVISAPILALIDRHSGETKTDNGQPLCSSVWETIALAEKSAAEYPKLAERLRELSAEYDTQGRGFLDDMTPYAQEHFDSMPDYFWGYTSESCLCVERADARVFSLRIDANQFTGGAHGNYGSFGVNFDSQTGKVLELADVLTATDGLVDLLNDALLEKYPADAFFAQTPLDGYEDEAYKESAVWTMDHQGVTFYFSPYEIGPYAAGLFTVSIRFDEKPELFVEKYLPQEQSWVKMLPGRGTAEAHLDGARTELSVYVSELEGEVSVLFVCGDKQYTLTECAGKNVKAYLVCSDGAYFLCVSALQSGQTNFYTYGLDGTLRTDVDVSGLIGVRCAGHEGDVL